ncbi:Glucodextran-C domain-containing protein [Sulfidibacter corallicola]|uniref:Glucodextranase-like C-terminal domain-containing protein n=1 Tax=Sulfidibacter corallicola TaxID=2818388 RepID=A0A8A4TQ57_SULCO|nr:glucodextranase DOMON-like domain-containing protein [Sulfidibacter corallicola]QTD52099.1 hypothetical protein J3U87_06460 [Sulfidibacter corallicola]
MFRVLYPFVIPALLLCGIALRAGEELFAVEDPRGDDFGAGAILYPSNADFDEGDLDLVKFSAKRDRRGTWFEVTFANPVRPVGNRTSRNSPEPLTNFLRHGFFNLNVDIYIDTDGKSQSGSVVTLPGRRIQVHPDTAWDKAVILTPRPPEARALLEDFMTRVRRGEARQTRGRLDAAASKAIRKEVKSVIERSFFFSDRIRVRGNKISFLVPKDFLGGAARSDWSYLVLVTASDPEQRLDWRFLGYEGVSQGLMMVPLTTGRSPEQFGLEFDADPAQPPIIDVLYPDIAFQKQVLTRFDAVRGLPATLPALPVADWSPDLTRSYAEALAAREAEPARVSVPPKRPDFGNRPDDPSVSDSARHMPEPGPQKGEPVKAETPKEPETAETTDATRNVAASKPEGKGETKKPGFGERPADPSVSDSARHMPTVDGKTPKPSGKQPEKPTASSDVDRLLSNKPTVLNKKTRTISDRLRELEKLKAEGLITAEEYTRLRQKILDQL